MLFLIAEALHSAAKEFQRAKVRLLTPMSIRLAVVGFGNGTSRIELPLGDAWGPKEQTMIWQTMQSNIGGGTPDFLGLETAQHLLEASKEPRLRLVLGSTDGDSDNGPRAFSTKEAMKATGTLVKMAGVGTGAKKVTATYGDDGAWLPSFDTLPEWAAEQVVNTAKKLLPQVPR